MNCKVCGGPISQYEVGVLVRNGCICLDCWTRMRPAPVEYHEGCYVCGARTPVGELYTVRGKWGETYEAGEPLLKIAVCPHCGERCPHCGDVSLIIHPGGCFPHGGGLRNTYEVGLSYMIQSPQVAATLLHCPSCQCSHIARYNVQGTFDGNLEAYSLDYCPPFFLRRGRQAGNGQRIGLLIIRVRAARELIPTPIRRPPPEGPYTAHPDSEGAEGQPPGEEEGGGGWCSTPFGIAQALIEEGEEVSLEEEDSPVCSICHMRLRPSLGDPHILANGDADDPASHICGGCASRYALCPDCGELLDLQHKSTFEGGRCERCEAIANGGLNLGVLSYHGYRHRHYFSEDKAYSEQARWKYADEPIRYYGIELEIDGGGEDHDNAQDILSVLGREWHAEHDGSLDEGMELVSDPCTWGYMEQNIFPKLPALSRKAEYHGYSSHDAKTCGLHVHVSRNTITPEAIINLLLILDLHWDFILTFSRRTKASMRQYANRYFLGEDDGVTEGKINIVREIVEDPPSRHVALNLCPQYTIEFRFPRGTLRPITIEATLRFVRWLCEYAHTVTPKKLDRAGKLPVRGVHPVLDLYLKERGLWDDARTDTREIAGELRQSSWSGEPCHG